MPDHSSRREFLRDSLFALGAGWLAVRADEVLAAAEQAAQRSGDSGVLVDWQQLSGEEARTLSTVVDLIWPPDEPDTGAGEGTGGAADLGAVFFMDAALGGFMAGALPMIREGLADLDRRAVELDAVPFADLAQAHQEQLLRAVEGSAFFGNVHFLTLCGLFALPEYGGNRDGAGWRQLGFVQQHLWQPPFGHYDAVWRAEGGELDA